MRSGESTTGTGVLALAAPIKWSRPPDLADCLLRAWFVGIGKFAGLLTSWDQYPLPGVAALLPVSRAGFMHEWALMIPGYYDIALRDIGLSLAAIALARLSALRRVIDGGRIVADAGVGATAF